MSNLSVGEHDQDEMIYRQYDELMYNWPPNFGLPFHVDAKFTILLPELRMAGESRKGVTELFYHIKSLLDNKRTIRGFPLDKILD